MIKYLTTNGTFAFFYIVAFASVAATAALTEDNYYWLKLSWAMLVILGLIIMLTAYVTYLEARSSTRWPRVFATLISAKVRSSIASNSSSTYTPDVKYSFSFKGRDFQGNHVDFSGQSGTEAWANSVIKKIEAKGIGLMVSVNTSDPEVNVLNPGIRLVHFLRYGIGIAMVALGVLVGLEVIQF